MLAIGNGRTTHHQEMSSYLFELLNDKRQQYTPRLHRPHRRLVINFAMFSRLLFGPVRTWKFVRFASTGTDPSATRFSGLPRRLRRMRQHDHSVPGEGVRVNARDSERPDDLAAV